MNDRPRPTRNSVGKQVTTVAGANNVLCGPSARRVGIVFFPTNVTTGYALSTQPMASNAEGAWMPPTGHPIELWADKHGSVVKDAWFAFTQGGQTTIFFVEILD